MDSRELFHLWANQSKPSARCGNVFFEGTVCYSYGHHFPIAALRTLDDGTPIALFNPDKYSNSTTRHQSLARSAVHGRECYRIDTQYWGAINDRESLQAEVERQKRTDEENADYAREAKREAARRKRAEAKQAKLDFPVKVAQWRAGEIRDFAGSQASPVLLRLSPDRTRVETSKGAQVPVAAAVRAWPLIKAGQQDPDFKWGYYGGLTIQGDHVVIGCHRIPRAEIDLIAAALNLA